MTHALRHTVFGVVAGALLVGGCAGGPGGDAPPSTGPAQAAEESTARDANDPLEPINRTVFGFNLAIDKVAVRPVTMGYRAAVPSPLRNRVHDFLSNLTEPVTAVHSLLQGRPGDAGKSVLRFAFNTTIGAGGLVDVAGKGGITVPEEDAGQTLGVWGTPSGPYLVLPLLGPSNPRDVAGKAVDWAIDPLNAWARHNSDLDDAATARTVAEVIDARDQRFEQLNELERTSVDFYAAVRSMYRQHRREAITNGEGDSGDSGMSLDIDSAMGDDASGGQEQ